MKTSKTKRAAAALLVLLMFFTALPSAVFGADGQADATPSVAIRADGAEALLTGYQMPVGATAPTLRAGVSSPVPGGAYSYSWRLRGGNSLSGGNKAEYKPFTDRAGVQALYCRVTYKVGEQEYTADSPTVFISVYAGRVQKPEITTQPASGSYLAQAGDIQELRVAAKALYDGSALNYQWYAGLDGKAFLPVDGAQQAAFRPPASGSEGTVYYRCTVTNTVLGKDGIALSAGTDSEIAALTFRQASGLGAAWGGEGTEQAPYLLGNADDLVLLRGLVNEQGMTFSGYYFEMAADIALPDGWAPIGLFQQASKAGKTTGFGGYHQPFSGVFDGGGHTLTVPENGLPLFGSVRGAVIKNLNIYGRKIAGFGLVNNYFVDYGVTANYSNLTKDGFPTTVEIDNVTIKSGSSIKNSGLIGGFASGANVVYIRNCTAEKGVVIGYDKTGSSIGSFAGSFNGVIENCVSYADVYGKSRVGGIVGAKGQTMGPFAVRGSAFHGTVTATEDWAGGIAGSGYADPSGPATPCVTIQNCHVTGAVRGNDAVGGIFGGEPVSSGAWTNGVGYVEGNLFAGTLKASDGAAAVGGVIGRMKSLNRYNIIANNYYLDSSAKQGVGEFVSINTGAGVSARDDDPAGAGAPGLARPVTAAQIADGMVVKALNEGLNSSGNWIQEGDGIAFGGNVYITEITTTARPFASMPFAEVKLTESRGLAGLVFTVFYSDGTQASAAEPEATLIQIDHASPRSAIWVAYQNQRYAFPAQVAAAPAADPAQAPDEIQVSFTLLGDSAHGEGETHTLSQGDLEIWAPEQMVTVGKEATVCDVFEKVLAADGLTWRNPSGNYIESVTLYGIELAEFTNGPNSGWMFTLNGAHPGLGVAEQKLKGGDKIVFHYTDDYTKEEGTDLWGDGTEAPGTAIRSEIRRWDTAASAVVGEEDVQAEGGQPVWVILERMQNTSHWVLTIQGGALAAIAGSGATGLTVKAGALDLDISAAQLRILADSGKALVLAAAQQKPPVGSRLAWAAEAAADGEKLSLPMAITIYR